MNFKVAQAPVPEFYYLSVIAPAWYGSSYYYPLAPNLAFSIVNFNIDCIIRKFFMFYKVGQKHNSKYFAAQNLNDIYELF